MPKKTTSIKPTKKKNTTKKTTKKTDEAAKSMVRDMLGDPFIAPHVIKGCQVTLCSETGSLAYMCVRGCEAPKQEKNSSCSPLQDRHFAVASLARKSKLTKEEKEALGHFASPWD